MSSSPDFRYVVVVKAPVTVVRPVEPSEEKVILFAPPESRMLLPEISKSPVRSVMVAVMVVVSPRVILAVVAESLILLPLI